MNIPGFCVNVLVPGAGTAGGFARFAVRCRFIKFRFHDGGWGDCVRIRFRSVHNSILLIVEMGADTDGSINKKSGSKSKQNKKQQGTGIKNDHENTSKYRT
mgnify:CR=1 FL=1